MNTTAVSKVSNSAVGSPTSKTGSPVDTPFDQVFSRELSNRAVAEPAVATKTDKPAAKESQPANQAAQDASSAQKPDATDAPQEQAATSTAEHATGKVKDDKTAKAKSAADVTEEEDEQQAVLPAASAELLALVTTLAEAATPTKSAQAEKDKGESTQSKDETDLLAKQPLADDVLAPGIATALTTQATGIQAETDSLPRMTDSLPRMTDSLPRITDDQPHLADGLRNPGASRKNSGVHANIAAQADDKTAASKPDDTEKSPRSSFDTALGQAKDGQVAAAADTSTAKAPAALAELAAAAQNASGAHAAKPTQETIATPLPMQVAAASPLQQQQQMPAANLAANNLTPQVGTRDWDQALGQKVVWMASGSQQSASLTLNPPDLGPLQVVLHVTNNQATANFTAAQPEVRQALENAMPKLREMLGDAGIQLGQANVNAGNPNNPQSEFKQSRQTASSQDGRNEPTVDAPVRVTRVETITGGRGLVDTFV